MKKLKIKSVIFVLLIFLPLSLTDCEKKVELDDIQDELVQKFLDSKEFCKNETLFNSYGSIGKGKIETINDGENYIHYLMIPIMKSKEIVAYIQALEIMKDHLPNNEIWAMNLIDLKRFNYATLTGEVSMYDLNFDAFLHTSMMVSGNKITSWLSFDLPKDISLKYDVASKGKIAEFFACYREIRDYYDSIDVLNFICDWAGVSCASAATAFCLYHAFDYET
jgi:hypothetical protein